MQEVIICKAEENDFGFRWFAAIPPDLKTTEREEGLTEVVLMQDLGEEVCQTEADRLNLQQVTVSDPWNLLRHYSGIPVRYYVSKPPEPLPEPPPRRRGRLLGFTPSGKPPMVKKSKSWSFPEQDWKWIESHPNQSQVMRDAIALYRSQQEQAS